MEEIWAALGSMLPTYLPAHWKPRRQHSHLPWTGTTGGGQRAQRQSWSAASGLSSCPGSGQTALPDPARTRRLTQGRGGQAGDPGQSSSRRCGRERRPAAGEASPPRHERDAAACHFESEAVKKLFFPWNRRLAGNWLGTENKTSVLA